MNPRHRVLARFLVFYAVLFAAFGVVAPFLPALLQSDGLGPGPIGLALAFGTAIRTLTGPLGGRAADRARRPSSVLALFTAAAAIVALGYGPARGFALVALVSIAHAAVLAPLTPIADALTLGSASTVGGGQPSDGATGRHGSFRYGTVRGAGSAAFVLATLASGALASRCGLPVIIPLNAAMLGIAAVVAPVLPDRFAGAPAVSFNRGRGAVRALLGDRRFVRLIVVAGLILGSHSMHDGFEVIRWRAAGRTPFEAGVLWSLAVASEVLVFTVVGPPLLARIGPRRALMLAAAAGAVRWATAARTAAFSAMVCVEPLHGLTFALMHLACMATIRTIVPVSLAATAQAFYATVAAGAATALATAAAGPLYAALGPAGFWPMVGLCVLALPIAAGLRLPAPPPPCPSPSDAGT